MICQHQGWESAALRPHSDSTCHPLFYRVDFRDAESNTWRVYARFEFLGEAEACRNELQLRGFDTRLGHSHALAR